MNELAINHIPVHYTTSPLQFTFYAKRTLYDFCPFKFVIQLADYLFL